MDYKVSASRGAASAIGIIATLFVARKLDKDWASPPSAKLKMQIAVATILTHVAIDYGGYKGYYSLGPLDSF